ncbi:agmatinase [bacterium]|jgi:agmatinase|nr:agmatinase [bacterium]
MIAHQRYLAADSTVDEADVVLVGVPFDGTACFRPGARFGPQGIRFWSDVLETYSRIFDADLEDLKLADAGDLQVLSADWQRASVKIHRAVKEFLQLGAVPILMGGEHLITLPAVEASAELFPGLVVLHMDAHMDLRDKYEGLQLSHATVMRRVMEKVGPDSLLQYGIRSGTREEWALSEEKDTLLGDIKTLPDVVGNRPVYLSVDLDILDPSVMPETGAPEPGGISFPQLHEAILACRGLNVIAGDVVEYCPLPGGGGPSGAVAAKVVRELIFLTAESRNL